MRIACFAAGVLVGVLAEKVREYVRTFYVMPGGVIPLNEEYFGDLDSVIQELGVEVSDDD